jgi:ABC-type glycerol-3-phosphate transport system substrate-binding protein
MKKLNILLSVVILFSLVLAACAPKVSPPPAEEPKVEEPKVEEPKPEEPKVEEPKVEEPEEPEEPEAPEFEGVTVQFWHVYSDAPGAALQALVDEFNDTNPYGIFVDSLDQGSYRDIEDKMNAGIQSGDLPDVVMAYTNALADWYSVGFIADLNPYINDTKYGLTSDQLADLYPHLKAAGSMPDGAWVAYPMTQSANVLVYNFTWAEELGFLKTTYNFSRVKRPGLCSS